MDDQIKKLENRIELLEKRNLAVEKDKAWETSGERRVLIAILTYFVVVVFFFLVDVSRPFVNASVPTGGFLLSTLSMSFLRSIGLIRDK